MRNKAGTDIDLKTLKKIHWLHFYYVRLCCILQSRHFILSRDQRVNTQIQFIKYGHLWPCSPVNTLMPRQNGRHLAEDTFKRIFLNLNVRILIKILLKFVFKGPINNIPGLVPIMAWCLSGDKSLSEPVVVSLLTHIYASLGLNEFNAVWCFYHDYVQYIMKAYRYDKIWMNSLKVPDWGPDKMVYILWMTFSNAFSWMKMFVFWWIFGLKAQLTVCQHWSR